MQKRIPCEVYSRIVGYFRPIDQWNSAKKEEFHERHIYATIGKKELEDVS